MSLTTIVISILYLCFGILHYLLLDFILTSDVIFELNIQEETNPDTNLDTEAEEKAIENFIKTLEISKIFSSIFWPYTLLLIIKDLIIGEQND